MLMNSSFDGLNQIDPKRKHRHVDHVMTTDLHVLWREWQEVGAALDTEPLDDDDPAWQRFPDLDQAIREARPTDPAGLAIQVRLLADAFAVLGYARNEELALYIARALEEMGQAGQPAAPPERRLYCLVGDTSAR
jgi:hypothetical protein